MMERLFGPLGCIRTVSGKYVDVRDPDPDTLVIEDIAHALSHQCRFGGHLPRFYTVAQHSVKCMRLAPDHLKLQALMHDASEAYLLDIPRPIKYLLPEYLEIEAKLMSVLAEKFGFSYPIDPVIKAIDDIELEFEWENIMLSDGGTNIYSPEGARIVFMDAFKLLNNREDSRKLNMKCQ